MVRHLTFVLYQFTNWSYYNEIDLAYTLEHISLTYHDSCLTMIPAQMIWVHRPPTATGHLNPLGIRFMLHLGDQPMFPVRRTPPQHLETSAAHVEGRYVASSKRFRCGHRLPYKAQRMLSESCGLAHSEGLRLVNSWIQ